MTPAELVDLIRKAAPPGEDTVRLATVATVGTNAVEVIFDGETVASVRQYPTVGYTPTVGDRAVMLRVGNGWVAIGEVGSDAVEDTDWQTPSFLNSWEDYGSTWAVRYRRLGGVVYLSGLMRFGTFGLDAFVLPAGFRPAYNHMQAAQTNSGTQCRMDYLTTGAVRPYDVPVTPAPANSWVSVSHSFPADA